MPRRRTVLVALLALGVAAPAGAQQAAPARLSGHVHYKHGSWPIRVQTGQPPIERASLDFPALGLAGLEAPAREADGALIVELPFGLGEQTLAWSAGAFRTTASPEDPDAIAVVLNPDHSPAPAGFPMSFDSDGVDLRATLYVPHRSGDEPLPPLVVVGHGAGPDTRTKPEYAFWAAHLTRLGYATLLYDKRGFGESDGDPDAADIAQLSRDLVSAVNAGAHSPHIDPERIALLGHSQFGWTATRACRDLEGIDALVLIAAPAVDPVTLESRVLFDQLRRAGIRGDDLADAKAYVRLYFAASRYPKLFDALIEVARDAEGSPWIEQVPVPSDPSDFEWWGRHSVLDPSDDISELAMPVFLACGWNDTVATPELNALRYENLIRSSEGATLELWIADEANHRLEVPAGMVDGAFRFPQLAPGFLERIDRFLAEHLGAGS